MSEAVADTEPTTQGGRLKSFARSGWAALLFFTLTSVAFTWPLATHMHNTLPDWGDPADSSWRIGSIARQLLHDPLHLYETEAFYPLANDLALDELLTGQALLGAPLVWLTGNLPLVFNLLSFASFVLSGFAMWLLVRHLTGSSLAGLVAGMVFAFSPWHYGQYGHLGLLAQQWMVFALYFLVRFMEASSPRPLSRTSLLNLALFAFFFALQALSAGYYAYHAAILVGLYLLYHILLASGATRWLRDKMGHKGPTELPNLRLLAQQMALIAAAGVVSLLALLPFVIPFLEMKEQFGFQRDLEEVSFWSAEPASLLRTTSYSWLYERAQVPLVGPEPRTESELYPGLVATLLAITGLLLPFRPRLGAPGPWLFALVAIGGLVLSFGPVLNLDGDYRIEGGELALPYMWLYEHLPGFDSLRVPHRFGLLFMLGIAVCAGFGTAHLVRLLTSEGRDLSRPYIGSQSSVLLAFVGVEFFATGFPAHHTGTGEAAPPIYRWLAGEEAAQIIGQDDLLLELPISSADRPINTNPLYVMYGLSHGRPMLNGSANIVPRGYDRLFYEMRRFPAPTTLDIIEALGVNYLVVHTSGLLSDDRRAELEAEARSGERLELIKSFSPDYTGNPQHRDEVYRVRPGPERFERMAAAIPEGSSVFLAEFQLSPGRRLYTNILPVLIGPNRHYTARFRTIYDPIVGVDRIAREPAPGDYVIMYKADDPAIYGYSQDDQVDIGENDLVAVYHRRGR